MTLNVKVNDLHFQYQPRVSQDARVVQIWWFQLKSVTSYRADKAKFTDRQADRQTDMMTSSNGKFFRVTGPFCGEFTGHRLSPLIKASDAELWCFLWSATWISRWVNNREAGDLRRHRAHYDVIVWTPSRHGMLSTMTPWHGNAFRITGSLWGKPRIAYSLTKCWWYGSSMILCYHLQQAVELWRSCEVI